MRLKIVLPDTVLLDMDVLEVVAPGLNGSFGLLPRHVDFVAALRPGLLRYRDEQGNEGFAAVDAGILVKRGSQTTVATHSGVLGSEVGALRDTIVQRFESIDQRERQTRSALASLESNLVRRFVKFGDGARI